MRNHKASYLKCHYENFQDDSDVGIYSNGNAPGHFACDLEGALWQVGCQTTDTASDEDNVTGDTLATNGQAQSTTSSAAFFSSDWHINDQWTITAGARYTQEEKEFSGGFFGRQSNFTDVDAKYEPEYVKTFELGLKSEWLGGRMIFNPTIFMNSYEDKQESVLIPIDLTNVSTVVRNAGNLDIFGVERELLFQVTEAWNIRANYGYLDAEYDDFFADLNGELSLMGSYRWRDEVYTLAGNEPESLLDSIENMDAKISYTFGEN